MNGPVELGAVACSTWSVPIDADLQQACPLPSEKLFPATIVVNLPERATLPETRTLLRDLRHELEVDRPHVVLDLSEVKEMDTAGLDLLVECLRQTVRRDGTLSIRAISLEAATILELTGMDKILEAVPHSSWKVPEGEPAENVLQAAEKVRAVA